MKLLLFSASHELEAKGNHSHQKLKTMLTAEVSQTRNCFSLLEWNLGTEQSSHKTRLFESFQNRWILFLHKTLSKTISRPEQKQNTRYIGGFLLSQCQNFLLFRLCFKNIGQKSHEHSTGHYFPLWKYVPINSFWETLWPRHKQNQKNMEMPSFIKII